MDLIAFLLGVLICGLLVKLLFDMHDIRHGLNSMQLQSEAWIRIHNDQQQSLDTMSTLRGEVFQIRKRLNELMDQFYHGLEIRKHLGELSNTHDMVMELHRRRGGMAEIQHVMFIRGQLTDLGEQLRNLQRTVEALPPGTTEAQYPLVRLAIPEGSQLHLQ